MITAKLNLGAGVDAIGLVVNGSAKPGWSAPVGGSGMVPQPNNTALFYTEGGQVTLNEPARNSGTYTITASTTPEQDAPVTFRGEIMEEQTLFFDRGLWQYETDNGPLSGRWELLLDGSVVQTVTDTQGAILELDIPASTVGQAAILRETVTQGGVDYSEDINLGDIRILSDSFTAPDGTGLKYNTFETGIEWADWGGIQVHGNTARCTTTGQPYNAYQDRALSTDHFAEADLIVGTGTAATNAGIMLSVRRSSGANFFTCHYNNDGTMKIGKRVSGAYSEPHTQAVALTPGQTYKWRFEAQGSTLRVLIDGAVVMTATDTDLATGTYVGVAGRAGDTSTTYNHIKYFHGGNL